METGKYDSCVVYRLGLTPYQEAWQLQEQLAGQVASGAHPPALLLLEHPHTFTFGRRGQPANLLWSEAELEQRGVQVLWVDRGGDVTYHGPGQLVGYPILSLAPGGLYAATTGEGRLPQADYVGYLRRLEQSLILALARFGVSGLQIPGLTGVWVQMNPEQPPAKIAAIGVKVDARGVSRHGFALNVDPDMRYWQGIIGCGLKDSPQTSLAGLLEPVPTMAQVLQAYEQAFCQTFGYELIRPPVSAKIPV